MVVKVSYMSRWREHPSDERSRHHPIVVLQYVLWTT